MKRTGIITLLLIALAATTDVCAADADSTRVRRTLFRRQMPTMLTAKWTGGTVFPTKDFLRGDYRIPFYQAYSAKFAFASLGNVWQDVAYGMPYYGLGVSGTNFGRRPDGYKTGNPVSVYLLQGATIFASRNNRVAMNYEWNLGVAAGWRPFDPFDNPHNECIGSEVNVHIGIELYLKFVLSRTWDLHLGVEATHFSNGATRLPNSGINAGGAFVELACNFNRTRAEQAYDPNLTPPEHDDYYVSDLSVIVSSRSSRAKVLDAHDDDKPIPNMYIDRSFKVLGLSYAALRASSYRYRYGLSLDMVYDESAGVRARNERHPVSGYEYVHVKKGSLGERFQTGISAKGEIVLPAYTIFANLGYDIVHGNDDLARFYQIFGMKIYLKDNFFGTFGIRADNFSRAQFLFWSLGYSFDHTPADKRRSRR